ncbi:GLOBIN domain-containing protein [Aphelenchoides besseyi]|nr:GLOBIN domain-containing protein [Aphelenchoides besseyi]
MGNNHGTQNGTSMLEAHAYKQGFVARRKQKLEELRNRRQSMPLERLALDANHLDNSRHSNFTSFAYGDREETIRPTTPKILVNGTDSSSSTESVSKTNSRARNSTVDAKMRSVDIPNDSTVEETTPPKRHRFIRNNKPAASRRMEFLSFKTNFVVRSLDECHAVGPAAFEHELEIDLKPLSYRARSLSPLKLMRTYTSHRNSSDEEILSAEQGALIRSSWKCCIDRLANSRTFGLLALKRFLQKRPELRSVFGVEAQTNLEDLPEDSSITRHAQLLYSIIDLAVRNVDELESEIGPVIFVYGRRHFSNRFDLQGNFNEETVRLFCGQVICTILDITGNQLTTGSLEAWIELMRFLGRALINGYEFESLNETKKKFVINTNNHAFYLA